MERCKICNDTGNIPGTGETCDCRIKQVWRQYLGSLIRETKSVDKTTILLVDKVIEFYAKEERKQGKTIPKHLYMFDDANSKYKYSEIYKSFFLYYLLKTKEYLSYKRYDLMSFIDMYWGVESAEFGEFEENFYKFNVSTFLLECKTLIPNKYAFITIRHFLDYYKNCNIIIYASTDYKEKLKISSKDDKGRFHIQEFDVSLYDILKKEYTDFINVNEF